MVDDGGRGHDEAEVVLAFEALLDDVHVEEAEEAAAEAKAKGDGGLGLKDEGGIVELEFFECLAEVVIVLAVLGIEPAEDHGRDAAIARQCLARRTLRTRHGIADAHVAHVLQRTRDEADLARAELARIDGTRAEAADVRDLEGLARRHEFQLHALLDHALLDAYVSDHALICVEVGVKDERAQWCVRVALGRRDVGDDSVEDFLDADAGLCRGEDGGTRVETDAVLDFLLDTLGLGTWQVNFVDDGHDLEVVLEREVDVRQGLCLHALRRVHDEECALARGKAARDLVVEVDVSRCVDEVQFVQFPVLAAIVEPHGLCLDGDAALALEIHAVEHLRLHLALTECPRVLDEAVGNGGFSMVDVGDDGKIADMLLLHRFPFL